MFPDRATLDQWAKSLGFQEIGITDINLSDHKPHVQAWLKAGFAGEMGYLNRNLEKRLDPSLLEPKTCRVISARMDYLPAGTQPLEILDRSDTAYISRYALGRDYHKVLRRRLAKLAKQINAALPEHKFRAFTDTAPVLEKALAHKAGLGWVGKHSLILNKNAGSWFFIGEIYTNAPFECDPATTEEHCGKCTACMTVCPTDAIVGPKILDARRCISYLTIEHRGAIPEPLRAPIGNRIYGCDDCQLYCPWNREAPTSDEPDFQPRHGLDNTSLLSLFALSEAEFLKLTEGSAMRRVNYEQWQRNLAVAIGNGPYSTSANEQLRARLTTCSPLVAEHIRWALTQLAKKMP